MPSLTRLARIRTERNWTQAGLAARSGVPRSSISAIEIGRLVPAVDTALALAAALDVSVEALFGAESAAAAEPELAWAPRVPEPWVWEASVGDAAWRYPVEATAAGALPPDGRLGEAGFESTAERDLSGRTLVIAGCDPSVGLLAQAIGARRNVRVLPLQRSSREALDLLRSGRAHVAGIHLSDASGHALNADAVRDTLGAGYTLLHQMRWEEGIAVASGARSLSVSALLRRGRWVNREPGSAARLCLDQLLQALPRPAGYLKTVRSHHAVAATVSSGWADAGICTRTVAEDAGLRFLGVHEADYELCVPDRLLGDPVVAALVEAVRSREYRRWIAALPGCRTARTGEARSVGVQ